MRRLVQWVLLVFFLITSNYVVAASRVDLHEMSEIYGIGTYITSNKVYDINDRAYSGKKLIMKPNNVATLDIQLNKEYEIFEGVIIPLNQNNKRNGIYVDVFFDGNKYERINNLFTERNCRHKFKYNVLNVDKLTIVAYLPENWKVSTYLPPSIAFYRSKLYKHTHSNKKWITVQNQSCVYDEVQNHVCGKCSKPLDTRVTAKALGHSPDNKWIVMKKSTCIEVGSEVQKCTRCEVIVNRKEINMMPHTYNDKWIIEKQPTCLEEGIEKKICQVCKNIVKRNVPLADHKVDEWVLKDGDVLNNPIIYEGICTVCKKFQVKKDNSYKILEITVKYILPLFIVAAIFILWRKGYRMNLSKSGKTLSNGEIEKKFKEK